MEATVFTRYYGSMLTISHILLMTGFIFMMNISREMQVGSLVLSGLIFGWLFHMPGDKESLCGAEVGSEGIARPRPVPLGELAP